MHEAWGSIPNTGEEEDKDREKRDWRKSSVGRLLAQPSESTRFNPKDHHTRNASTHEEKAGGSEM